MGSAELHYLFDCLDDKLLLVANGIFGTTSRFETGLVDAVQWYFCVVSVREGGLVNL